MDSARLNIVSDPEDKALSMLSISMEGEGGSADHICETPPRTNPKRLAEAILRSLGKQRKVQSVPKKLWEHVQVWLAAEDVHRLFFTRASSLQPEAFEALDELRHQAKIDIWILDPSDGSCSLPPGLEVTKWAPEGFEIRQWEIFESRENLEKNSFKPRDEGVHLGAEESLNEWPSQILSASFLGFLTACERSLDTQSVVGEIKREFHTTLKMFQEEPYDDGLMGYNSSFRRRTLGRTRFALSSATSEQRAYIRLKAAQVYAFGHGFYLRHPDVATCQRAAAFHPGLRQMKAFSEPNDAALGLVSFGTGLCLNDLIKIRGSYERFQFGGLPLVVPEECTSIIRAAEYGMEKRYGHADDYGSSPLPLFAFSGVVRSARPYFSLFKDLLRVEERSRFRAFNMNWPVQWGFRMLPLNGQT